MAKTGYVWDGTQFISISSPIAAVPNAVTSYNSIAPAVKTIRTNLVTNPSFEVDTTGWVTGYNPNSMTNTVSRSTAQSVFGSASLLRSVTAGTAGQINLNYPTVVVQPSQSYSFSVYVRTNRTHNIQLVLSVTTSSGTIYPGSIANVLANTWTRLSYSYTMPSGLTAFALQLVDVANVGDELYVDAALIEINSTLNQYFDGTNYSPITEAYPSSITTAWTGTANASTSTISYYKQSDVKIGQLWIDSSSMTIYVYTGANWAVPATTAITEINLNLNAISADYTMATGYNGTSAGPMTINSGIMMTIPTGSVWTVV